MSYGLYANTTATIGQLKQLVVNNPEYDCNNVEEGKVLCFSKIGIDGSVAMGFHTQDDEEINTMCIRGSFEDTMRQLILQIDPGAHILDEHEYYEGDDEEGWEPPFENEAISVVDISNN